MLDRYNFRCFRPFTRLSFAESEPQDSMRHQTTKALHAYWEELRDGRFTPLRSEVEPTEISALLPNTFILERNGGEEARFRMTGDAVCDLIGIELNGMNLGSIWADASRGRISQLIEGVTSAPATGVVAGKSPAVGAIDGTLAEFCFLPLRADSGEINRIIGSAVVVEGERVWRGPEPRLFNALDLRLSAIQSNEARPETPMAYEQPAEADYPTAAESGAPFELKAIDGKFASEDQRPVTTLDRARPHLRVVRDED